MSKKKEYQLNTNTINNIVSQTLDENLKNVKPDIVNFFVSQTKEKIKSYEDFLYLKSQVQKYYHDFADKTGNQVPLETCFKAYELLLDIRKFFLGDLGEINYSILWSYKEKNGNAKIYDMIISHKMFRDLLLNEDKDAKNMILGLNKSSEGNIRMDTTLLASLQEILFQLQKKGVDFTVDNNFSNFSIHNDIVGRSQDFNNANLFKAAIENAEKRPSKYAHYKFKMDVKLSQKYDEKKEKMKDIFHYTIKEVSGRPRSSSVFSAIAKYAADEKVAKEQKVFDTYNKEIQGSINTGVLTEIYKLAKDILNNGHNHFQPKRYISGKTMYDIFKEVKGNSDPFYMGGDILTDQIKSFLGSLPSLTSFTTIKNGITKFYDAFNKKDLSNMKNELTQILIKDEKQQLYKVEQQMSKKLTIALDQTFNEVFGGMA